jgi:16S rRNA (cytosine967-C5)-methyltransferase
MPEGVRDVAVAALRRTEHGAFAGRVLEHALAGRPRAERALATELVYGTLRRWGSLTAMLRPFLRGPGTERWPDEARLALYVGAYQLVYLDRVPPALAVDSAVRQATRAAGGALGGVVNGVLRRLARDGPAPPPDAEDAAALAAAGSHPAWLARRWRQRYGTAEARRLMAFHNQAPPLSVRARSGAAAARAAARLWAAGVVAARGAYLDRVLHLAGAAAGDDLDRLAGEVLVPQDEAAALAGALLGATDGDRVVDACAGLGTKTTDLAARVGPTGDVLAVDAAERKLGPLRRAVAAAGDGVAPVRTEVADARDLARLTGGAADRVLLDAPCSGLGALRRRPEIRWRRAENEFAALSSLQRELLAAALRAVRPGGEVLYVTCSLEPEETDEVVERVVKDGEAQFAPFGDRLPPSLRGLELRPGRVALFGPDTGTDGFFYALLRRTAAGGGRPWKAGE